MMNETTMTPAQQLLADYANGRRDFAYMNLTGADLSGANLTGADLTGAHLTGAHLTGADLTGADLTGANLYRADLTGANLTGAHLYRANLTGAHLTGANLYRAHLTGAHLRRAKNIPISSHDVIAELLRQAAGSTVAKRQVAGVVLVSRDWCWREFSVLARRHWSLELRQWIVATLSQYDGFAACFEEYPFFSKGEQAKILKSKELSA